MGMRRARTGPGAARPPTSRRARRLGKRGGAFKARPRQVLCVLTGATVLRLLQFAPMRASTTPADLGPLPAWAPVGVLGHKAPNTAPSDLNAYKRAPVRTQGLNLGRLPTS